MDKVKAYHKLYLNDDTHTLSPFETYLKYNGSEKVKAVELATQSIQKLIESLPQKVIRILDVGCGNGEMTEPVFSSLHLDTQKIHLTCLDRSERMINECKARFKNKKTLKDFTVDFVLAEWSEFEINEPFDIILASYAYLDFPEGYKKVINALSPVGTLVIVNKMQDDEPYNLRLEMRKQMGITEPGITIDTITEHLKTLFPELHVSQPQVRINEIIVPKPNENETDFGKTIEFMFTWHWDEIPDTVQKATIEYLNNTNFKLNGLVGLIELQN
jgi:SAM-dependent methyltransferase